MLFFDQIIKRVNNFSIQSFYNNENVFDFFKENELFQLAILHSSASLHDDILKEDKLKTFNSLVNYFKRAHFNSTPFGFYSSVGILNWDTLTNIEKDNNLYLDIKYDNRLLSNAIKLKIKINSLNRKYCLNPTVSLNNNKINFHNTEFEKNGQVKHNYIELDYDEDLSWIINKFRKRISILDIKNEILKSGFNENTILLYFKSLIEMGLIIDQVLYLPYTSKLCNASNLYDSKIIKNNNTILKTNGEIKSFKDLLLNEHGSFNLKKDEIKYSHSINVFEKKLGSLDAVTQQQITKIIDFTINYNSDKKLATKFIDKFIDKIKTNFNDGFISLNSIFSPYIGIKYSDFIVSTKPTLNEILAKLILKNCDKKLSIKSSGADLDIKRNNLPATFSVLIEKLICKKTGNNITYFKEIGFESALNVLARFDKVTETICQDIVDYEKKVNSNKLIAELNFIGSEVSVNIHTNKQLYDYSIPINTSYSLKTKNIFLSDLYLHIFDNKCNLVSKKYKKQIITRRTTAVNHEPAKSEIFTFLSHFSLQNEEIYAVNFNFNQYEFQKKYVPRIYLDNDIILYPAQLQIINNNSNLEDFTNYLIQEIHAYEFTKIINIPENGKNLILNTKNKEDLLILFNFIKDKKHIYVTEFLYESFEPVVKRNNENYSHELVISVKNPHYFREIFDYEKTEIVSIQNSKAPILDDWLYLELYCNSYADNEIHKLIYDKIIKKNKCEIYFFINYANPERHIRVRFKTVSLKNKKSIIEVIHELKVNNYISKYLIVPYDPEDYRYGGKEIMSLSEKIFDLDSRDFLKNILNENLNEHSLKIMAILKIKNYLLFLNFTLDNAIDYCDNCILNYSKEFKLTSQLRKDFNKEYAEIKIDILEFKYDDFFTELSLKKRYNDQIKIEKQNKFKNTWLLIHMSMNRHFSENQRFNEFKIYYLTKSFLNQLKFQKTNKN